MAQPQLTLGCIEFSRYDTYRLAPAFPDGTPPCLETEPQLG